MDFVYFKKIIKDFDEIKDLEKICISTNYTKKFQDSLKSLNNEKIKKSLIELINAIQK